MFLFFKFFFPLFLLLSKKALHLQQGPSFVPLVCYANTHIQANTYRRLLQHLTAAIFFSFFFLPLFRLLPLFTFLPFPGCRIKIEETVNRPRLSGRDRRRENDHRSRLKMASDRRLSCCCVSAGARGEAGASFECQSDACVPHFKPGNFSTILALRPRAAGNHLVQCRGALRTRRWTDEKRSTGRNIKSLCVSLFFLCSYCLMCRENI